MINKILKKYFFKDKIIKSDVSILIANIRKIALTKEKNIAICIENTGTSFLGIKNATFNLFPKNTIVLPAYYSEIKLTDEQLTEIVNEIKKHQFNYVVISTLPISLNNFLDQLCDSENVNVIFHGALSELSNKKIESQLIKMITYTKAGKIKRLGFVKSGLDKWAKKMFDIDCIQLQLKPVEKIKFSKTETSNSPKIKIGVFGNTSFNKNLYNQIAGALAVDGAEIHTTIQTGFDNLGYDDRIVIHPFLDHLSFIKLMSEMTLNLHLSFSEGMGGQIFTESLSQGVPCLTSYNNEYLKFDKYLQDLLTVEQYDNPWEIKIAIEKVLNEKLETVSLRLIQYSYHIQKEHEELLETFLKPN
jgi:hypothetical protein